MTTLKLILAVALLLVVDLVRECSRKRRNA